uniref:Cyclin-like domain-containing protein n=1 Tax=Solanum lycopersicum TaxID=4081 RepID=K4BUM5_SOLLC
MESSEYLTEEEDEEMQQENGVNDDDDDDNNSNDDDIQILISREITDVRLNDQEVEELVNDNWNQEIRTHAIRYISRTGRQFRMSRRTIYRAAMYVDRFLAQMRLENGMLWAVRLLAVTCLALSAKMNDNIDDVPSLSEYPLGPYEINVNHITRMERLVLDQFSWNMNCVTPFDFGNFFVSRFCRDVTRLHITRITTARIIMIALRDLCLMNHRPSVIAAAATLLAVNRDFTIQELVMEINDLPINGFLQMDHNFDLAVTCLSLSAKMNENIDDVPPYPVGAYNINVNAIRRMEILVFC